MSGAHTPGPWFVEADGAGIYVVTETMMVASPSPMDKHPTDSDEYIDGPETEANARLIAAAPELLEELRLMVQQFAQYVPPAPSGGNEAWRINKARAAIAKAEGAPDAVL